VESRNARIYKEKSPIGKTASNQGTIAKILTKAYAVNLGYKFFIRAFMSKFLTSELEKKGEGRNFKARKHLTIRSSVKTLTTMSQAII